MTFGPANTQSSYLPIEFDIPNDEKLSRELIAKRERLTASVLNVKETAQYEKRELLSGQQWFNTATSQASRQPRYGFRTTVDLIALNGGNIPNGVTTNLNLTASTIPPAISGAVTPLPSGGSATDTAGVFYFLNEAQIYVRFNPATNIVSVTNNCGNALTQCYFEIEYLKS